ncbi:hypothetical protein CAS74_001174 [Pichia kudriavzevii]|uniref:RRM domain-containing protein n=1 Tax=Pichia kudriavzevii TaxID=4909 RepID=A0A1Z8JW10_PICKU|nr:hypothetical protein CAS74_001174 [Pichia kudriavzevii]
MSALEQSLDAIIAQNKPAKKQAPPRRNIRAGKSVAKTTGKRGVIARRPVAPAAFKAKKATVIQQKLQPKIAAAASLEVATKVVVSGLPKDLNQRSIQVSLTHALFEELFDFSFILYIAEYKNVELLLIVPKHIVITKGERGLITQQLDGLEFFTQTVGPTNKVTLSYNEKGKSTGVATVIFKNATVARKAVAKYNNAPIDNGRSTLKLELVVDTTKVPLAARIQPNVVAPQPSRPRAPLARQFRNKQVKPVRAIARNRQAAPKKQPKKKKTIEELDQEMADYFSKNENQS